MLKKKVVFISLGIGLLLIGTVVVYQFLQTGFIEDKTDVALEEGFHDQAWIFMDNIEP